jgi:hypothetical protein
LYFIWGKFELCLDLHKKTRKSILAGIHPSSLWRASPRQARLRSGELRRGLSGLGCRNVDQVTLQAGPYFKMKTNKKKRLKLESISSISKP